MRGGKVETSPSNRKKRELPRSQAARRTGPATEPECGPAAGLILGGWGPRAVEAMWDSFSSHPAALYWTPITCEPLTL